MSAAKYKELLKRTEEKLLQYQTASEQWREIASERLDIIKSHGMVLTTAIDIIAKLEEVLGIEISGSTSAASFSASADASAGIDGLGRNIETLVTFAVELSHEASELDSHLDTAYERIGSLSPVATPSAQGSAVTTIKRSRDLAQSLLTLEKKRGATKGSTVLTGANALVNSTRRSQPSGTVLASSRKDIL